MADVWDQFPDAPKDDPWAQFPDATPDVAPKAPTVTAVATSAAASPPRSFGERAMDFYRSGSQFNRELTGNLKSAALATGRDYAQGALSIFGLPYDAAVGVYNYATNSNLMNTAEAMDKTLNDAGLPQTQNGAIRFVNQIAGGTMIPIPGMPKPQPRPRVPSKTAGDVIAEGERRGVPVFYDDVTQGALARRAGVAAEPLGPLGTGSGRARQAVAADDAAQAVVATLDPGAADDVPVLVQKGLQTKLKQLRGAADRLYTRAAQQLDPRGSVPTTQFDAILSQEIAKQQSFGTAQNQELVAALERLKNAPRGNFSFTRELREQLSGEISKYYTGNAAIGDKGVGALQAAKNALETDMEMFAKASGGGGYSAWKTADGFYKTNIVPFKVAGFRDLAKSPEPEKAWRYLVAQDTLQSRATRLYNALDNDGRAAVRYGLVKDAMDSARNPNGSFSPAKFAKYLEDHDNAVSTFFKGTDLREIQGFRNLMRHVERAGQFAENPPTGQRLVPYALGGAALASPETAATIAASGLSVRALFQTKTGRDLLLRMSTVKAGTPQAAETAARITRLLRVTAAGTASQATSPEPKKPAAAGQ